MKVAPQELVDRWHLLARQTLDALHLEMQTSPPSGLVEIIVELQRMAFESGLLVMAIEDAP